MLLKKLNDVAGFDTSNSAGKSDFIASNWLMFQLV